MSPDSIPQISLGTAALIIFAVCAGFVLLRGMTRMIIGTVVLSLSTWIGFRVWQAAPTLSFEWTGKSSGWITSGLPIATFLISFFVIRKIAKSIFSPPKTEPEPAKPRSIIGKSFLLLLALIPTSLLCLIGATFIHHNGSIAEVRAYSEKSNGTSETTPDGFSQRLKSSIEDALPESWIRTLDPLTQPSRLNLAKLIAAQSESPRAPVINPQTGKPIPRAIIVDDPELQNLAREGKFSTLLRHPLLTKALADPKIQKLLRDLNL
ncbi:MAG: hypothetical protein V4689_15730 [Verrucomicrobiota bacterium]